jgi:hypothetical protein
MRYDVLIQPQPYGFQAIVLGWPDLQVIGESESLVIEQIKKAIKERLTNGKLLHLNLETDEIKMMQPETNHLWSPFLGMWADDPTFDDFLAKMASYRHQLDEVGDDVLFA